MNIREKIEAALKEHGPMDSRTMRKRGLKHDALAQYLSDLVDRKVIVRLGGGPRSSIYALPGQKLAEAGPAPSTEPLQPRAPKTTKAVKKVKRQVVVKRKPKRVPARPTPASPAAPMNGNGNGAQFAINEHGELGIELDDAKIRLDPIAFARLREFIERTQPVWEGAPA
jgi:hypothetical protein